MPEASVVALVNKPEWTKRLTVNDKGKILPSLSNATLIMANDHMLKGMLAYNAFRSEPVITRNPPANINGVDMAIKTEMRPWTTADVVWVQAYVQRVHTHSFSKGTIEDAMLAEAEAHIRHPVKEWLATLAWDGAARLATWLHSAFGCPTDAYHQAVATKALVAAVRRVRVPGCKFDFLPVLEGNQGIGKSRTLEALFGAEWFSDAIPSDLSSKDAAMALLGVWGLELSEIDQLIRNEVETTKAFLSRRVDRYRPPYGRAYIERPRQGVMIGTTNADDYLRDATGNRRIWPIRCLSIDTDWVAKNRDQLWAEAAHIEKSLYELWLNDSSVAEEAHSKQASRMSEDVWGDKVALWLKDHETVKIPDILEFCLDIPTERHNKASEMRVARLLQRARWCRQLTYVGGVRTRVWRAIEVTDSEIGTTETVTTDGVVPGGAT